MSLAGYQNLVVEWSFVMRFSMRSVVLSFLLLTFRSDWVFAGPESEGPIFPGRRIDSSHFYYDVNLSASELIDRLIASLKSQGYPEALATQMAKEVILNAHARGRPFSQFYAKLKSQESRQSRAGEALRQSGLLKNPEDQLRDAYATCAVALTNLAAHFKM